MDFVEPVKFRDQRQKIRFFPCEFLKIPGFFHFHFFFMKITFFCIFFVESDVMLTKVPPAGCWHVLLSPPGGHF